MKFSPEAWLWLPALQGPGGLSPQSHTGSSLEEAAEAVLGTGEGLRDRSSKESVTAARTSPLRPHHPNGHQMRGRLGDGGRPTCLTFWSVGQEPWRPVCICPGTCVSRWSSLEWVSGLLGQLLCNACWGRDVWTHVWAGAPPKGWVGKAGEGQGTRVLGETLRVLPGSVTTGHGDPQSLRQVLLG